MTMSAAHVTWLGNRVLLLACRLDGDGDAPMDVSVLADGRTLPLEATGMSYRADDGGHGRVIVAHMSADAPVAGEAVTVSVRAGDGAFEVETPDPSAEAASLRDLLRSELSGLDAEQREQVLAFIVCAAARDLRAPGALTTARRLAKVREALREQLPIAVLDPEEPYAVHVDAILAVDQESFWIKGWVHDEDRTLDSLTAVSPEGARADLLDGAYRFSRLDIEELYASRGDAAGERHGLIKFLPLEAASRLSEGWTIELCSATGAALEVQVPEVQREIQSVRSQLLGDMIAERPGEQVLIRDHVYPAIERIQKRLEDAVEIDTVVDVGDGRPDAPALSVIVPLYKRIDFLEHQLAHFGHDPEMRGVELVYALDSPELADKLLDSAHALSALHELPLRVVLMKENAGFSGANNAAVSVARGRRVVLLNSDVIPDRPGWLGKMSAFYDATPGIGALGPKLLYEDDSLQHAGLYFYRDPGARVWGNQHYYKGLHRSFPAANVARAVPGVTAACMMVDRDLYEQAGGLSHAYVQGGYEDSDLCLRLIELGRQNWYMPGAELYHLEAQSYPTDFRKLATIYNMWLHTHLWNDRIDEVCREYRPQAESGKGAVVAEPAR